MKVPEEAYGRPESEPNLRATDAPSLPDIPFSTSDIDGTMPAILLPEQSPEVSPVDPVPAPPDVAAEVPRPPDVAKPVGPNVIAPGSGVRPFPNRPISRPDFEWTSITGIPRPRTPAGKLVAHQVFVSYRRGDSDDITNRMIDFMKGKFADGVIFFDLDAIDLGFDFRDVIRRAVASCRVFLAVIGKEWLTVVDDDGHCRLDDPLDFVRLEIEAALQREIPVIPVLVRQARMPKE